MSQPQVLCTVATLLDGANAVKLQLLSLCTAVMQWARRKRMVSGSCKSERRHKCPQKAKPTGQGTASNQSNAQTSQTKLSISILWCREQGRRGHGKTGTKQTANARAKVEGEQQQGATEGRWGGGGPGLAGGQKQKQSKQSSPLGMRWAAALSISMSWCPLPWACSGLPLSEKGCSSAAPCCESPEYMADWMRSAGKGLSAAGTKVGSHTVQCM